MLEQPVDFFHPVELSRDEAAAIDVAEDVRGAAEATALIGTDVTKGLQEVRRLTAEAKAAYAIESQLEDEFCKQGPGYDCLNPEPYLAAHAAWPGLKAASAAADEAGHHHHYAVMHVWRLPILSINDIAAKVQFALENRDYSTDEDLEGDVLKQIAAFFAPAVPALAS